ncbi:MAG: SH3 domain-containing protein [Rhodospirillaceae bacterium]|jgi:hypothetical protein|nr:SH3 domain-containing protein [Rhodospirillales bacterium]MBT3906491.1 SH3 domain-containing protein [Rhodospirillaceae bacterium]MBT4701547.1 SH3 domain-containing protein [Rhodospirillaceae bacterium]MBT5034052.1 SH3 domain-containing protein [Rhodospirillaceae bacterium]MBT6218838.1 SH3 domain-containing protein [Rhodospirillaceae bacterium]
MARTRQHPGPPTSGTKLLFMILGVILGSLVVMEALSQVLFQSSLSGTQYINWNKQRDQSKTHYDVTPMSAKMVVSKATAIRQAPSESGMKVGMLTLRDRVQVTGKINANNATWYEIVRFDGRAGYVSATSLSR